MATKVSYYIRVSDKKADSDATIFARLTDGRKADIRLTTTLSIPARYWDEKRESPKDHSFKDEDLKNRMEQIEVYLKGIKAALIDGYIKNESYTKDDAQRYIEAYFESKQTKKGEAPKDILAYLNYTIPRMKSGEMRHKGNVYEADTIKVWSNFEKILKRFIAYHPSIIEWESIDKNVYDSFVGFMEKEGYMLKSINKYIICFKALINFAISDKLHNNNAACKAFYKLTEKEELKAKKIYLTEKELQALFEMELEKGSLKDIVRDVFLCGCYTAQRISDYKKLSADDFGYTAKGTQVVRMTQVKTGNNITIPIFNKNLLTIADKYERNIPEANEVVLNRYIKDIFKELSQTVPSLKRKERTILTMKERKKEADKKEVFERDSKGNVLKPRYNLVHSHTARRSAITNLYLTGLFDNFQLKSISGHKTERSFLEYICLSSNEIAEGIDRILREREEKQANNNLF